MGAFDKFKNADKLFWDSSRRKIEKISFSRFNSSYRSEIRKEILEKYYSQYSIDIFDIENINRIRQFHSHSFNNYCSDLEIYNDLKAVQKKHKDYVLDYRSYEKALKAYYKIHGKDTEWLVKIFAERYDLARFDIFPEDVLDDLHKIINKQSMTENTLIRGTEEYWDILKKYYKAVERKVFSQNIIDEIKERYSLHLDDELLRQDFRKVEGQEIHFYFEMKNTDDYKYKLTAWCELYGEDMILCDKLQDFMRHYHYPLWRLGYNHNKVKKDLEQYFKKKGLDNFNNQTFSAKSKDTIEQKYIHKMEKSQGNLLVILETPIMYKNSFYEKLIIDKNTVYLFINDTIQKINLENKQTEYLSFIDTNNSEQVFIKNNTLLNVLITAIATCMNIWEHRLPYNEYDMCHSLTNDMNEYLGEYGIRAELTVNSWKFFSNYLPATMEDVIRKIPTNKIFEEHKTDNTLNLTKFTWNKKRIVPRKSYNNANYSVIPSNTKYFYECAYVCPNCNKLMNKILLNLSNVNVEGKNEVIDKAFSCKYCKEFFAPIISFTLDSGVLYYLKTNGKDYETIVQYMDSCGRH